MEDKNVNGLIVRSYLHAPASLNEVYKKSLKFSDSPFLVFEGKALTFQNVYDSSEKIAAALQSLGVNKGDRVAIAMSNCPEWVIAFMAITRIGGIAVALNSWGEAEELEYSLNDAGAKYVFVDQRRFILLAESKGKMEAEPIVVQNESDISDVISWQSLLDLNLALSGVDIAPEDYAYILYTSGTTGKAKGAVTTHYAAGQTLYNGVYAGAMVPSQHPETIERLIARGKPSATMMALPLFHGSGIISIIFSALWQGTRVVILPKWNPEQALRLIEQHNIGVLSGAAKMIWDLLEHPDWHKYDTDGLCNLMGVGAAQPETLLKDIRDACPDNFFGTGYGMTECNMYAALNTGPVYLENLDSVGLPYPVMDFKVIDEDGNELPHGEAGEVCIKGPSLISGYWRNQKATDETIIDGWLHGGDVGYINEEGMLYICDRKKDIVIRGGENIYCAEVETVINAHTAIEESAVFGLPHERWGEELAVSVRLKRGETLADSDLQHYVSSQLAHFKVPAHIYFEDEPLPRNAMQKVIKHEVKKKYI
nr:class I adenylate-forming enzyme family protein [Endozoicomonas sp. OPT23]